MTTMRAAIIGCGPSTPGKGRWHSFAYAHGWAYTATQEITLVAAASRTPRNVEDFCADFPDVQGYRNFREMLAQERPNLVSICVHPHDRDGMVEAALEAGATGIWLEKPFAESLGEARRLMEMTAQAGARLFINTQRRYGLPFNWLKEAVAERIGTLQSFEVVQGGPNLLSTGTHLMDAALYALGDRQPTQVLGAMEFSEEEPETPADAHIIATVHLSDGVRMTFEAGYAVPPSPVFRANGSEGFAELYFDVPTGWQSVFRVRYAGEAETVNPATNEDFHHSEDPALYVKRAAADIAHALRTGAPTRIDATESYRTLEVLLGIAESASQRRMLPFPIMPYEP